jgi:hypothetical protein
VAFEEIPDRLTRATRDFTDALLGAGEQLTRRPSPTRWSALEYGGHLRDVLISIRERIILAAIVENPTGVAMNRDERVALGLYRRDTLDDVVAELAVTSRLLIKTLSSLGAHAAERPLIYSTASPTPVTIGWAAAQAVHEAEHHLGDIRENRTVLDAL